MDFPQILRQWRQQRRWPQLELALRAAVSQRHLSFLEAGRAKPSREMVLRLAESLDVPLRERNRWLLSAGYAPAYTELALHAPEMTPVRAAVEWMLRSQEPYPAVAVDRAWNLLAANQAFERICFLLGEDLWLRLGAHPRNLLRLFFHPAGVRSLVLNWPEAAPKLWQRAWQEWESTGYPELGEVLRELEPAVGPLDRELSPLPVLPVVLSWGEQRLSLFSVISTFGTAQDVTADEIRLESLFPADEVSEELLRHMGKGPQQ